MLGIRTPKCKLWVAGKKLSSCMTPRAEIWAAECSASICVEASQQASLCWRKWFQLRLQSGSVQIMLGFTAPGRSFRFILRAQRNYQLLWKSWLCVRRRNWVNLEAWLTSGAHLVLCYERLSWVCGSIPGLCLLCVGKTSPTTGYDSQKISPDTIIGSQIAPC